MPDPDDDDDFLRRFAVEIAAALREKEDSTTTRSTTTTTRSTTTTTTTRSTTTRPYSSPRNPLPRPGADDSVEDLYRALVFDEPLVHHIPNLSVVASALARQLGLAGTNQKKRFALSNRLVNGIVYLCNQNSNSSRNSSNNDSRNSNNNNGSSNNNDSSGLGLGPTDGPSHSTIQIAMAKLAFSVLVEIPLECCRDNSTSERSLTKIRALLGSYKGTPNPASKRSEFESESELESDATMVEGVPKNDGIRDDDDKEEEEEEKTENDNNNNNDNDNDNDNDNGIGDPSADPQYADEVWAAESDPSDYDYGEGDNDVDADQWRQQQQQQQQDGSDWLDPSVLSQPDPQSTLQQTRDAVGSLLRLASYTLLQPIFGLPPKETARYLSQLQQLTLVLLQPRKPQPSDGDDDCDGNDEDALFFLHSSMDHAVLSPLWILRDAASYHNNNSNTKNNTNTIRKSSATAPDYEQTYLQVLQTLLGMDQAYLQDLAGATHGSNRLSSSSSSSLPLSSTSIDLCVPSIVGLSALSSWCASQQPRPTRATIDALVDSMNDLDHVVQRGRDRDSQNHNQNHNLPHTLIPILEVLSGISYDDQGGGGGGGNHDTHNNRNHDPSAAACYRGSTIPQTLLNSGFLRQILALAVAAPNANANTNTNTNANTNTAKHVSLGFEHALWGLCVAYPKIVGKYVFRYPGSSELVRSHSRSRSRSLLSTPRTGLEQREDNDELAAAIATAATAADPLDCVQSILWNTYGWHQCRELSASSGSGGGGLTLLRKPGSCSKAAAAVGDRRLPPKKKLTPDECSEVCAKAWSRLCRLVRNAVAPEDDNDYNNNNNNGAAAAAAADDEARAERVIREWGRLLALAKIPSVSPHVRSLIDASLLDDVAAAIATASRSHHHHHHHTTTTISSAKDSGEEKEEDDNKDKKNKDRDDKPSRKQKIVSRAHKLLKEYRLFFQGTIVGSSKTD